MIMTTLQHRTCLLGRRPAKQGSRHQSRNRGWVNLSSNKGVKSATEWGGAGGRGEKQENIKLAVATEFLKIGTWNVQTQRTPVKMELLRNEMRGRHRQRGVGTGMGTHGYGERIDRWERLLEFASQNKLFIANTRFQQKDGRRWTWMINTNMIHDSSVTEQRGADTCVDCQCTCTAHY